MIYSLGMDPNWSLQQINLSGVTDGPAAVGGPSTFVYESQTHILYLDGAGKIWDSFYAGNSNQWLLQQINLSGVTAGPAAVGNSSSFVYGTQTHILYCDGAGKIWDSYYDGNSSQWLLQQINLSGVTAGPAAAGDPFAFVYVSQTHILYLDFSGKIWDSFYAGNSNQWLLQQINLSGVTAGPAAVGKSSAFIYGIQTHILYRDAIGTIWDSYYDGNTNEWLLQQINLSGVTAGPAAVGDPSAFVYGNQTHITYRDAAGIIWDSYYDGNSSQWLLQQINLNGVTPGPAAAGDASSFAYQSQAHILYRDTVGAIWDSFYDGITNQWSLHQINVRGGTNGPAAVGDPASFVYGTATNILYRDASGKIWDASYVSFPEAPSGLHVTVMAESAISSRISLGWADNSNNETGFELSFSAAAGAGVVLAPVSVPANTSTYSLIVPNNGTTYIVNLKAYNAAGSTNATNQVTFTLPSAPPPSRSITVARQGTPSATAIVVTGSGFTPNSRIVIRVVPANLLNPVQFSKTADADGNFLANDSFSCVSGVLLTVTAFEDANPANTISNAVQLSC